MKTKFDETAMRLLLRKKHLTISGWAKKIGISRSTLYRKINGDSDFWRDEIQATCDYVGEKSLTHIFFSKK